MGCRLGERGRARREEGDGKRGKEVRQEYQEEEEEERGGRGGREEAGFLFPSPFCILFVARGRYIRLGIRLSNLKGKPPERLKAEPKLWLSSQET
jgi:hypothetical protein